MNDNKTVCRKCGLILDGWIDVDCEHGYPYCLNPSCANGKRNILEGLI